MDATEAFAELVARLCRNEQKRPVPCQQPKAFADLVRKHRLAPLAYALGHSEFKIDYAKSGFYADQRRTYLLEILGVFSCHGVKACLLKGVSYIERVYPEPAHRPMGDIDLLIPEHQMVEAIQLAKQIGYRLRPDKRAHRARTHHAVTLDRAPVCLDLHRNMIQPWRSSVDMKAVWQRSGKATGYPGTTYQLDSVDEIVLHLVHIVRHEFMVGALAYIDYHRLHANFDVPVSAILERAKQFRLGRAVECAIHECERLRGGVGRGAPYLPSTERILADMPLPRWRQLVTKSLLVEGPYEFAGLLAVAAYERWPLSWKIK